MNPITRHGLRRARMPARMSARMPAWLRAGARAVVADARRHPLVFATVLSTVVAIWALALTRVFVHHTPVLPVLFNWTPSLPYLIVVVDHGPAPLVRGDLIVYAFDGEAAERDYPGLKRQPFFKRVVGVAGDVVTVDGRDVFINGLPVGRAKTHTLDRRPLDPIAPCVIPPGHVYVQGSSADSFDSRYSSSGLVRAGDVVAHVQPLL
jgi:conjugal transfer pilin signal peptidase TrbI